MSYINLLVGYNTVVPKAWMNDSSRAFDELSDIHKSEFVLEQSVMVCFIKKLYNYLPPVLLRGYIKRMDYALETVNAVYNNSPAMDAEFKENVAWANDLMNDRVPGMTQAILDRISSIISREDFPHVADSTGLSFYRTFLSFYSSENMNVSSSEPTSIPTFALRGRYLFVNYATKFIGYDFTKKTQDVLDKGPYPISRQSIFGYLSGYNWKDYNFNQLLGILSTYCFDLDNTNVSNNSYELIYKIIRSTVTSYKSAVSPYVDSLAASFDDAAIRRLFITFVIDLRKLYGLKLDDAQTLASLMGNNKQDDIENLTAYLTVTDAADVSVEMLKAFKNSIFSDFEELFVENRSFKKKEIVSSEAISATQFSLLKKNLKALYHSGMRITDTAVLSNDQHVDGSDTWSTEADDLQQQAGNSSTGEGAAASGDVGATGDDDTAGTESDTAKETSTTENGEATPSKNPNPPQEKENAHVPDLPDVSDKKGVKLELSSSESTDTVFYRLELKTYINSILANPPKTLSVQKIEMLKKIKAFWINTLSPQCIHDVLNAIVRLPSMFKIHKRGK